MASIFQDRRSRFWYAKFRDREGRQVARSTKIPVAPDALPDDTAAELRRKRAENRRSAQQVATEMEESVRGHRTEVQLRRMVEDVSRRVAGKAVDYPTVRAELEGWLERESAAKKPNTVARYRGSVEAFLKSLEAHGRGEILLADLRTEDFENFKAQRQREGLRDSSIRADLKTLNIRLRACVKAGKLPQNPLDAVTLPDGASAVREPFSLEEVELLLAEAKKSDPPFVLPILLGAFCGLRLGDAVAVRWSDVDLLRGTLTYEPKKTSRKRRRLTLPLHPRIRDQLVHLEAPAEADAPLCPELERIRLGGKSGLSLRFQRLLKGSGIRQQTTGEEGRGRAFNTRTFHSLRHTYVSALEAAGVPPDQRMLLAGHLDTKSHSTYSHTSLETLRQAVEKLP